MNARLPLAPEPGLQRVIARWLASVMVDQNPLAAEHVQTVFGPRLNRFSRRFHRQRELPVNTLRGVIQGERKREPNVVLGLVKLNLWFPQLDARMDWEDKQRSDLSRSILTSQAIGDC